MSTNKVAKRNWSVERFTESVEKACARRNIRTQKGKIAKAYEDGFTVAGAVALLDKIANPIKRVVPKTKKAA